MRDLIAIFFMFISMASFSEGNMVEEKEFKDKEGNVLGKLYVKWKENEIFISSQIIKNGEVIYSITHKEFVGKKGLEFKHDHKPFHNYVFTLIGEDYFEVAFANNEGRAVSDSIMILWEDECKCFSKKMLP